MKLLKYYDQDCLEIFVLLSTFLTIAKVFISSSNDLSSIGQKFNNQNSKLSKVCTRNDELRLFPQFNGFIFSSQS